MTASLLMAKISAQIDDIGYLQVAVWQWCDSGASPWINPRLHTMHVFPSHALPWHQSKIYLLVMILRTSKRMGNVRRDISCEYHKKGGTYYGEVRVHEIRHCINFLQLNDTSRCCPFPLILYRILNSMFTSYVRSILINVYIYTYDKWWQI